MGQAVTISKCGFAKFIYLPRNNDGGQAVTILKRMVPNFFYRLWNNDFF